MMPQALHASPAADRHVFVYGTLRSGGSNDIARWLPAPQFVGAAEIAGTLHDLGAYPGARLGGSARLYGEVYRIEPALEAQLDQLEEVRPDDQGEYLKRPSAGAGRRAAARLPGLRDPGGSCDGAARHRER